MLTVQELCEVCRVTQRTIYRWHRDGRLPAVKIGRRLLFDPAEVEAVLQRGRPDVATA